jgi:hypothetical protein
MANNRSHLKEIRMVFEIKFGRIRAFTEQSLLFLVILKQDVKNSNK